MEELLGFYQSSMCYYSRLSKWGDVFGDSNIIVRPFESIQLFNNSLSHDFLHTIGIDDHASFKETPRMNESLTLEQVIFLMETNKYLVSILSNKNESIKVQHQQIRERIIRDTQNLTKGQTKTVAFSR